MNAKRQDLDRRITFESRGTVKDPRLNTVKKGNWAAIANGTVWAQVLESMPSRAENLGDEINTERARRGSAFGTGRHQRATCGSCYEGRVLQIVAGPAEIFGRRKWLELMAEEYLGGECRHEAERRTRAARPARPAAQEVGRQGRAAALARRAVVLRDDARSRIHHRSGGGQGDQGQLAAARRRYRSA
jgi:hypothetical protein